MNKEASIYILGFQKKGGAQLSFFREALIHAKNTKKQDIFFFVSGKTAITVEQNTNNFFKIEHSSKLPFGFKRLIRYLFFLFKEINKIKNQYSSIRLHYTTPLISLFSSFLGKLLCIKYRRYRIGGILFSFNYRYFSDICYSVIGYIFDFIVLSMSTKYTFVSHSNLEFYRKFYPFKKLSYSKVIYSPCCDLVFKNENIKNQNYSDFYKIIENESRQIIITLVNSNFKKGSQLFYKIASAMQNERKYLFVHLGARKIQKPYFETENLLVVPNVEDIKRWIDKAKISILLSRFEGLPQVVPQSLSLGTPVIAFDVAGINDCIIHEYNGLIINPKLSIKEIISIIKKSLSPKYLENLTKNTMLSSSFFKKRHSKNNLKENIKFLIKDGFL